MDTTDERQDTLPQLSTPADLAVEEQKARLAELRPYFLDPRKDYPEPHYLFEYKGVGFSPLGGIQAISGQKKNGKTFMLAQLMAAALGGEGQRLRQYLGGLQTRASTIAHLGHAPRILYCDTEMEQLNTAKVLRRVHWLCELPTNEPCDRFQALWLREVPKTQAQSANRERWRLIRNAVEIAEPDILFIDGLRDLVDDFNDNAESAAIVGELMSLASSRNMCIWSVLHYNPRMTSDDASKMRGHLGTELGNKVSDTFISTKKKDAATGAVTFTVSQQDARGKDVEDWKFTITDDMGGLGIPRIIAPADAPQPVPIEEYRLKVAAEHFASYPWTNRGARYTDLEKHLRKRGVNSNARMQEIFDVAREAGIIFQDEKRKYHYKGIAAKVADDAQPLPFPPEDSSEGLPY